jgi:hypothetical protein
MTKDYNVRWCLANEDVVVATNERESPEDDAVSVCVGIFAFASNADDGRMSVAGCTPV